MGLGRFGGGVGVTRWLVEQHDCEVVVTDLAEPDALADSISAIQDLVDRGSVTLRLGEHNVSDFTTCGMVVANPAVAQPWDNRFLRAAVAAGIRVTTEIQLAIDVATPAWKVIGVTGSAGKSTTTTMIHHILSRAPSTGSDPVLLGGNLGGSLLETLSRATDAGWLVVELSSAMLYWIGTSREPWSPHVAVVTNIAPNHVDWHGTFDHYRTSKKQILTHQSDGDLAVLLDPSISDWRLNDGVRGVTDPICADDDVPDLRIPGRHNKRNAVLAATVCHHAAGIELGESLDHLQSFPGLPHRLQAVPIDDASHGRRFFNDSKSTTPEATVLAIESFESPGCIHLIAGGYDKGVSLEPIAQQAGSLGGLYTIGAVGPALASEAISFATDDPGDGVQDCGTLDAAVKAAIPRMNDGDVLLLSPGCASWDQFRNFEARGEAFTAAITATLESL